MRVNSLVLAALVDGNAPPELIHDIAGNRCAFDAKAWLRTNVALRIADDLAMFEHVGDGIYQGHVFFASRGKQAIERGRTLIAEMLSLGARSICGETPLGDEYRSVHWFNRQLGFKPVREVERPWGRRLFYVLWGTGNHHSPCYDEALPLVE